MTLIVNLFGAPCSGKSTTRADVFRQLKSAGVNCEETYETAKKFTWAKRDKELTCQPYIFAKQLRDLEVLVGQVDVIITDCPLILSRYYTEKYCPDKYPKSFIDCVAEQFKSMPGVNYFLDRVKPYNASGRNQTEEEADTVSIELRALLDHLEVSYTRLPGQESSATVIVDDVMFKLGLKADSFEEAKFGFAAKMFRPFG